MSTTIVGQILAEVDGKYADIFVETGRGWGGDGEDPYKVILNCPGKDLFMLLTVKQAQHLCELIQTLARMDEEAEG